MFPLEMKMSAPDHMYIFLDASYSSFDKDSGSSKYVLGDPVFAEVVLLKLEDRELELYLRDCWATPSQDPLDVYRWNLLTDGYCYFSNSCCGFLANIAVHYSNREGT